MRNFFNEVDLAAATLFCAVEMSAQHVYPRCLGWRYKLISDATKLRLREKVGKLLISQYFPFGLLVARDLHLLNATSALYAVLSLTFVRMLPVAIALAGAHLNKPTVLFLGWFGPRGLASIVLGLIYLEHEVRLSGESTIRLAVMTTVLVSIFAHGLSAAPGISLYARRVARRQGAKKNRSSPSRISD
jgi:NhaP-type Na+/H+ or K+/H+ antiporter